MSNGSFTSSRYLSTKTGLIHPIRVQPETLTLVVNGVTNAAPAGAIANPISAQVSQGKRSLGLNARTVTVKFPAPGTSGYKADSPISLPWLNGDTAFNAFAKGQAVTYQGLTGEVVGTSAETAR